MSLTKIAGTGRCDEHGPYDYIAYRSGRHVVGATCPQCLARGQQQAERSNLEQDQSDRAAARLARLQVAGVAPLFLHARFGNYHPANPAAQKNLTVISSYADAFDHILGLPLTKGMILTGLTGTGKTHLACALLDTILEAGFSGIYTSAPALITLLRDAAVGRFETSLTQLIQRYAAPQLLVLDEYGVHSKGDREYHLLYSVIDARYQKNLPTVMLTNEFLAALEQELDQRFLERVRGADGPVLAFDWDTYRPCMK